MTVRSSRLLLVATVLVVVVGLPLAGKWARQTPETRCALDGQRIDSCYRVRIVDDRDRDHEFCSIQCARLWLDSQKLKPRAVLVTDETTGEEIDATAAWFVRSQVVTQARAANRIHAFASYDDAQRHARAAWGRVLTGADKPF
jgi:hypothetical protein